MAAHDPALLPGDGVDVLQRTAGNQAVVELLDRRAGVQRQPKPDPAADEKAKAKAEAAAKAKAERAAKAAAKAKEEAEKAAKALRYKDLIAQQFGSSDGGPFTDWADYQKKYIKSGTLLGHSIGAGVRPAFQKMLDKAKPLIDAEYDKTKTTPPKDYGITYIGGWRDEISPHGGGVAIDIDGGKNPYVMHQAGTEAVDKELGPVYKEIAEFILNDPIDGEQSIIPKVITLNQNLPKSATGGRAERLGQYWDRLKLESDAMIKYFQLMGDETALKAFLDGDWKTKHPKATPPAYDDVIKQMWQHYRILGGRIPKKAPASVASFKVPGIKGRPFDPHGWNEKGDPGVGFMTLPREVTVGLGQAVPRWGAIDFGSESGDIMHFDDKDGLGKPFYTAKAAADAKWPAQEAAFQAEKAKQEAAEKAKAGAGSGSGSGSGSVTPPVPQRDVQRREVQRRAVQRRKEPGWGSSEGGVYAGNEPEPAALTAAQRLSGAHWKQIADDRWGGATPSIAGARVELRGGPHRVPRHARGEQHHVLARVGLPPATAVVPLPLVREGREGLCRAEQGPGDGRGRHRLGPWRRGRVAGWGTGPRRRVRACRRRRAPQQPQQRDGGRHEARLQRQLDEQADLHRRRQDHHADDQDERRGPGRRVGQGQVDLGHRQTRAVEGRRRLRRQAGGRQRHRPLVPDG